jgi:hypothetical protein
MPKKSTKNFTYDFQFLLEKSLHPHGPGTDIAKNIILSFPSFVNKDVIKTKNRGLLKIIIDLCENQGDIISILRST